MLRLISSFLLVVVCAMGQTTFGTITGTVTDPTGLPVAGVKVVVRNERTNIAHEATTDTRGNYGVSHLNPSSYSVSSEHAGFKRYVRTGVVLETAATVRVDVPLEVGLLRLRSL
ncbi:MAG: carboxypeptidase-like regulatory domain-containing protein [Bryobacterales bacterium]|nr:carboxypeptidase-like regulatory domain-containing protein [Bryobacterales bacterium]